MSCVSCDVSYIALLEEAYPEQVKSRLVYLTLIIAEPRYNKGNGWLTYNAIFRHNVAEDPTVGCMGNYTPTIEQPLSATSGSHGHNVAPYIGKKVSVKLDFK